MRYIIDSDGDGHWYLIPVHRQKDWAIWSTLDCDDPKAWDVPEWAKRIDGPESISFENPEERS